MSNQGMSLQSLIVLLVALCGCTSLVAHGQVVATRSGSDDENGIADSEVGAGGQSRTIYSHKHLSPHRMMHFGKRLPIQQAPGIFTATNQVLDLYNREEQDQEQQHPSSASLSSYPYTLYFPMPRDRAFEPMQQATQPLMLTQPRNQYADPIGTARNRQMMNVVQDLLGLSRRQQQQPEQQQKQLLGANCDGTTAIGQQQAAPFKRQPTQTKLMRLMKADALAADPNESSSSSSSSPSSGNNNESGQSPIYAAKKQSPSSGAAADSQQAEAGAGGQPEQRDASATSNGRSEGDEIDPRSSRSIGQARPLLPGLTRAQFSMLFGGQPSSNSQATSLLNFIKKAEPQRMTFMHFGRRR